MQSRLKKLYRIEYVQGTVHCNRTIYCNCSYIEKFGRAGDSGSEKVPVNNKRYTFNIKQPVPKDECHVQLVNGFAMQTSLVESFICGDDRGVTKQRRRYFGHNLALKDKIFEFHAGSDVSVILKRQPTENGDSTFRLSAMVSFHK